MTANFVFAGILLANFVVNETILENTLGLTWGCCVILTFIMYENGVVLTQKNWIVSSQNPYKFSSRDTF